MGRVPNNIRHLIEKKIASVAAGVETNNVRKMAGSDASRLRVGDYRVIYYLTETTMEVVEVGPRGSIYK